MANQETSALMTQRVTAQTGLRRNYLSLVENLAQTLGVLAPSGTMGVIIPLLILSAGNGTWLLLVITLSIFLLILLSVLKFAALHSSAGSLAAFSRLGWGAGGGLVGGWFYLLGMFFCIPSALLASASYFDQMLVPWYGPASTLRLVAIVTVLSLAAGLAAYRDIKLSTNLMLGIESVSVSVMLVLLIAGMSFEHAWRDPAQWHLNGVHFSGIQGGLVLAFMLMAGFEGTTSLGEESQDPRKTIPRAIVSCMLPLTALYLLAAYCLVSLENHGIIDTRSQTLIVPFMNIADALRWGWLGQLSAFGVGMSYFACGLASLTIGARVLFDMARDGRLPAPFGKVHPRNATPHRAIGLLSGVGVAVAVGMLAHGMDMTLSVNVASQLGSLGLIGAYLMMVLALPMYLRRCGLLKGSDMVQSAAATAVLLVVLILTIYPQPPAPYLYLPYVFGGCLVVGLLMSALRSSSRDREGAAEKSA